MRGTLSAALAVTAMLIGAMPRNDARAMPLSTPLALGAADGSASMRTRVAIVCGMNGCAPIHVLRVRRPPRSFVTNAAPLVFPSPNALPQPAAANK